jgi:transcriptional regulator GlxA family with amidase domain
MPMQDLDYVVVVGGLLSSASEMDPAAYDFLRRARGEEVGLVALCTGFLHLARAGLLEGRRVAVPWMYEKLLARQHPSAVPVFGPAFVEDDNIFTALGGIAGLELALKLVERHCGPRRARKCIDRLCIEATFAAHRIEKDAVENFAVSGDRHLERAAEIMRRRTEAGIGIEGLAAEVGISARQLRTVFNRHTGKSPARFWRDMRLNEARWRLVNSSETMTQIAYATGFSDAGHFTRSFKSAFGETPGAFRQLRLRADRARMG